MSRIAYLIAPDIHAAQRAGEAMGWTRLSATRFSAPGPQDVRFVRSIGEMHFPERPTDIWREKNWHTIYAGWNDFAKKEMAELLETGAVQYVNEIQPEEKPDVHG